jgi:hypothetical protein
MLVMMAKSEALLSPSEAITGALEVLYTAGERVDTGHWQGYATDGRPDLVTNEIVNLHFSCWIPPSGKEAIEEVGPSMPWAEEEFWERVGGEARNPHNSLHLWPWWHDQIETPFTHTYSERFWPRYAGGQNKTINLAGQKFGEMEHNAGIRYRYGDLDDLVELLYAHPYTRQATLPIFFPEDTGAVHGGRIPCTLHYHFLLRGQQLHLFYAIRSCDAVRHFRDDVYIAMRLCQWVIEVLRERELRGDKEQVWVDVNPGVLSFTAYSFHAHMGDWHYLEEGLA